uniref:Uncharacterized protein n=1 Tax=Parascaris univalens TaxID=6257 RepID=A0A915CE21_PARUN
LIDALNESDVIAFQQYTTHFVPILRFQIHLLRLVEHHVHILIE